jgi:hypothetical protein
MSRPREEWVTEQEVRRVLAELPEWWDAPHSELVRYVHSLRKRGAFESRRPLGEQRATVYVARGANGIVLYVGITGRGVGRLHDHAKASAWWPKATSIELLHKPTRAEAEALEKSLIRGLDARYNVTHGNGALYERHKRERGT